MNRTPPLPPPHTHTRADSTLHKRSFIHCNAFTSTWGLGLWHNSVLMQHKIRTRFKRQNFNGYLSRPPLSTRSFFIFFSPIFGERGRERESAHRRRVRVRRTQWGKKIKRMKKKRRIYCGIECVHLWLSVWQLCLGKRVDIRFLHFGTILFSLLQMKWKRQPKLSNLGPEKCFLWT